MSPLPTKRWGTVHIESAFLSGTPDGDIVVHFGSPLVQPRPLVRVHSECLFAEVLDSATCDCGEQLSQALNELNTNGGLLIYLRQEARGAGISAKVAATALEVDGIDTWESRLRIGVNPEGRDFASVGAYLHSKGIRAVRLLTNNPLKICAIEEAGVQVERVSLTVRPANDHVDRLYRTKAERFGHLL